MVYVFQITPKIFGVLRILAGVEEQNYEYFRSYANPWRSEFYFDAQITQLARIGAVLVTNRKSILITDAGKELVRNAEKEQ